MKCDGLILVWTNQDTVCLAFSLSLPLPIVTVYHSCVLTALHIVCSLAALSSVVWRLAYDGICIVCRHMHAYVCMCFLPLLRMQCGHNMSQRQNKPCDGPWKLILSTGSFEVVPRSHNDGTFQNYAKDELGRCQARENSEENPEQSCPKRGRFG